jgi:hypothetical protein
MQSESETTISRLALAAIAVVLVGTTVVSLAYLARARKQISALDASRNQMSTMLTETQGQIQALSQKLDALNAAQQSAFQQPAAPPQAPARARHPRASRAAARGTAEDGRWARMQTQLADQQKQLASTREEIDKTRADLQGKLDSTRSDLNGSIAKNHDELVQLEKRGERNYYEFTLTRSKDFQHVGPIGVSLRKVNQKHKYFDMSMMVDDFKLDKKHVNLFEPVWINLSDRPQPVELVVNRIDKNQVQGYISEPKYKKSELAAAAPADGKPQTLQTR